MPDLFLIAVWVATFAIPGAGAFVGTDLWWRTKGKNYEVVRRTLPVTVKIPDGQFQGVLGNILHNAGPFPGADYVPGRHSRTAIVFPPKTPPPDVWNPGYGISGQGDDLET